MSDDVLVVKINFVHDKKLFKQIYENILKQMNHGLVVLPYGYDAFVIHRDCDLKVEGRVRKSSNYEEDDNHGC